MSPFRSAPGVPISFTSSNMSEDISAYHKPGANGRFTQNMRLLEGLLNVDERGFVRRSLNIQWKTLFRKSCLYAQIALTGGGGGAINHPLCVFPTRVLLM